MANYKRWTPEEDALILNATSLPELAIRLGRNLRSLYSRRSYINAPQLNQWSDAEKKFIQTHPNLNDKEIAKHLNRPWTTICYQRLKLGVKKAIRRTESTCAFPGCNKPRRQREWCATHYARWYRNGNPASARIQAAPGEGKRRIVLHRNGKTVLRARVVWEKAHGPIPKGFHVHHKDGNERNDAVNNLELMNGRDHLRLHAKKNGFGVLIRP